LNESIFNESETGIDSFSGQKLIFRPYKNAQDISYYSINFERKSYIRDQHILFYHSVNTANESTVKQFFNI
jgi:hypothetical protein